MTIELAVLEQSLPQALVSSELEIFEVIDSEGRKPNLTCCDGGGNSDLEVG